MKKFFEKFFEIFFALNDSNLREIEKNFWALSFIAVVFVKFAVVFMNSTANMTKTTAMDTLLNTQLLSWFRKSAIAPKDLHAYLCLNVSGAVIPTVLWV